MNRKLIKLNIDPIIEAIFEVRFKGKTQPIVDLLPGLLFSKLGKEFPKLNKLPASQIPKEIVARDANFLYQPMSQLLGNGFAIAIGEKALNISCQKPYQGWKKFKTKIKQVLKVLYETEIIDDIERFSLKYINLLPSQEARQLSMLNCNILIGEYDLKNHPVQFRTEIKKDNFVNIIQVVSNSEIRLPGGEKLSGLLLDVDTIYAEKISNFWDNLDDFTETAHNIEKLLFVDMVKEETLARFDPVWEQK